MKKEKLIRMASLVGALMFTGLMSQACSSNTASESKTEATETVVKADEKTQDAVIVYEGAADLTSTPDVVTVIDFNATWCGPCRQFAPIFHAMADKMRGNAKFYSVDTDKYPDLARYYGIQAIPTVIVLRPDGTKSVSTGLIGADQLEALILNK